MDNQNDKDDQMDCQDENRCCSVIATSATRSRLINGSLRDKTFNPFTSSIDPGRRFMRQKMRGFGSIDVVGGKRVLIISTLEIAIIIVVAGYIGVDISWNCDRIIVLSERGLGIIGLIDPLSLSEIIIEKHRDCETVGKMSNPVVATGLDISQRWVLSNCSLLAGGAEMLARYRARSIVNPHKDFSNARKQDSIYSGLPLVRLGGRQNKNSLIICKTS